MRMIRYDENGRVRIEEPAMEYYGQIENVTLGEGGNSLIHFHGVEDSVLKEIGDLEENEVFQFVANDNYSVQSFYLEAEEGIGKKLSLSKVFKLSKEKGTKKINKRNQFEIIMIANEELPRLENEYTKEVYYLELIHGNSNKAKNIKKVSCISKFREELNFLDPETEKGKDVIKNHSKFKVAHMLVQNVGQGSTNLFFDDKCKPLFYIDVGYQNKEFKGKNYDSIDCPIFITHWDIDHYKLLADQASENTAMKNAVFAPFQLEVGIKAVETIAKLLIKRRDILFLDLKPEESIKFGPILVLRSLFKSKVNKGKNENSLYYFIENEDENRILLSGDCRYRYIDKSYKYNLDALVVYHHGAEYSLTDKTPLPEVNNSSIAFFSAGENKKYNHPTPFSCGEHKKRWITISTKKRGHILYKLKTKSFSVVKSNNLSTLIQKKIFLDHC